MLPFVGKKFENVTKSKDLVKSRLSCIIWCCGTEPFLAIVGRDDY